MAGRVPHKIAMELMLLGQEISATRVYEVGMINKVVKPESVLKVAGEYAKTMATYSSLVLSTLKKFVGEVIPKGPTERALATANILPRVSPHLKKNGSRNLKGFDNWGRVKIIR